MTDRGAGRADRTAPDGSPYPDRDRPTFERDVRAMFTHIARGYDWFDHVASLGSDFVWRPRALWDLDRFREGVPVRSVLDIGCGTGDLARLSARHFPGSRVIGADFTRAMLIRAQARSAGSGVGYVEGSALALPFPAGTFDVVTSAFVVRNIPRLPDALREMRRVLRPGGTLLTLEITEPHSPRFRAIFHRYFDTVVPALGALVGSAGPYRYLPESLRHLPDRERMVALFEGAGFDRAVGRPQSMGIVTTFLARAAGPGARGYAPARPIPMPP